LRQLPDLRREVHRLYALEPFFGGDFDRFLRLDLDFRGLQRGDLLLSNLHELRFPDLVRSQSFFRVLDLHERRLCIFFVSSFIFFFVI
jgi:hypothetical protein